MMQDKAETEFEGKERDQVMEARRQRKLQLEISKQLQKFSGQKRQRMNSAVEQEDRA